MILILIYLITVFLLVFWIESEMDYMPKLLIINKSKAQELEHWLKEFNWNKQELVNRPQLPKYKFYTGVVEVLLELARKKGGRFNEGLLFLREGLIGDMQSEKKLKELLLGVWLQMSLMFILTWVFIFSTLLMTKIKISAWILFSILAWQILAVIVLVLTLKWLRSYYFADIGKLWRILHILKSLGHAPLARSEIFQIAGLSELNSLRQKNLFPLSEKLQDTCREALKIGVNYLDEVNSLMGELRFQEKWHFNLFEKRLSALKLSLLTIFFLPSYLAFIFLLMEKLIKGM